jgi:hypothetical protein
VQGSVLQGFLLPSIAQAAARLLPAITRSASKSTTKNPICRANGETGATGLEPATSGVTGQFSETYIDDDGSAIRLFTSIFKVGPIGPA